MSKHKRMKIVAPWYLEDLRRERAAQMRFTCALQAGNVEEFFESFIKLEEGFAHGSRLALRKVSKLGEVHPKIKEAFLQLWINSGDHLRQEVNDDLVMIRALRVLLPRYDGPAQTLYRGETAYNRKRRTYGLSWSSKLDVADHYGKSGLCRSSVGGSVVLEVQANPDAIICAPFHHDNRYGEDEYLVDRRKLAGVKVLRHYPQEFKR
jgi:hypothetical protein